MPCWRRSFPPASTWPSTSSRAGLGTSLRVQPTRRCTGRFDCSWTKGTRRRATSVAHVPCTSPPVAITTITSSAACVETCRNSRTTPSSACRRASRPGTDSRCALIVSSCTAAAHAASRALALARRVLLRSRAAVLRKFGRSVLVAIADLRTGTSSSASSRSRARTARVRSVEGAADEDRCPPRRRRCRPRKVLH